MTGRPPRSGSDLRTDGVLIDAARRGDREALEALLRRHHDPIHQLCHRMCADRGDAEDATQEAMVAIVRGLARYDGRSRFSTWAYRVTTNACLDQLRRRARRPLPADAIALGASEGRPELPEVVQRSTVDPADVAVAAEQRSALGAALASLPEEFRVPVLLRDVADLDYAEIASVLELPPGTVRSRISRGRARLAELLGELDRPEPEPDDAPRRQRGGP